MTIAVARDANNKILETLLDDYARTFTKSKLQYLMVKLMSRQEIREDNIALYALTKFYLRRNAAEVTRHLMLDV